jgi:hypothetical protein
MCTKYVRELKRAIKGTGYRVRQKQSGRNHLLITNGTHTLTASCSPQNSVHTIRNVVRDIRKYGHTQ